MKGNKLCLCFLLTAGVGLGAHAQNKIAAPMKDGKFRKCINQADCFFFFGHNYLKLIKYLVYFICS